jgi:hypothetical protein
MLYHGVRVNRIPIFLLYKIDFTCEPVHKFSLVRYVTPEAVGHVAELPLEPLMIRMRLSQIVDDDTNIPVSRTLV